MIIDFNKIESISLFDYPFKGCSIVHVVLTTTSGKTIDTYEAGGYTKNKDFSSTPSKEKEASIPINSYDCDGCNHNETNKKIIQAFNHLRKLCSAPEPINFDGK